MVLYLGTIAKEALCLQCFSQLKEIRIMRIRIGYLMNGQAFKVESRDFRMNADMSLMSFIYDFSRMSRRKNIRHAVTVSMERKG